MRRTLFTIASGLLAAAAAMPAGPGLARGGTQPASKAVPIRNIVLVHGAFADGSGWRGVYNDLTGRGYRVTVVQNPLTSLADDVAATRRARSAGRPGHPGRP